MHVRRRHVRIWLVSVLHERTFPRQQLLDAGACFNGVREVLLDAPDDPLLQGMDLDAEKKNCFFCF